MRLPPKPPIKLIPEARANTSSGSLIGRRRRGSRFPLIGWFMNPAQFFQSYLYGLHAASFGADGFGWPGAGDDPSVCRAAPWGVVTRRADRRRFARAADRDACCSCRSVAGMPHLYEWTHARRGSPPTELLRQQGRPYPEHRNFFLVPGPRYLLSGLEWVVVLPQQVGRSIRTGTGDNRRGAAAHGRVA